MSERCHRRDAHLPAFQDDGRDTGNVTAVGHRDKVGVGDPLGEFDNLMEDASPGVGIRSSALNLARLVLREFGHATRSGGSIAAPIRSRDESRNCATIAAYCQT